MSLFSDTSSFQRLHLSRIRDILASVPNTGHGRK
nr:MAG TPA: hypothetical protein [Caudoviricetes sp.]